MLTRPVDGGQICRVWDTVGDTISAVHGSWITTASGRSPPTGFEEERRGAIRFASIGVYGDRAPLGKGVLLRSVLVTSRFVVAFGGGHAGHDGLDRLMQEHRDRPWENDQE